MTRIYLNDDWLFTESFDQTIMAKDADVSRMAKVRLPHTCKELPYHYFDEHDYQMLCGYRRVIKADKAWQGRRVFLTIDGAAHDSRVYINGVQVGEHHCGYTAFTMDISDYLDYGQDNILVVRVDSRENLNIPPFGYVVDYMTYGGIYRDVYIDIKNNCCIEDIFVSTKLDGKSIVEIRDGENDTAPCGLKCLKSAVESEITISNPIKGIRFRQSIRKKGESEFIKIGEKLISPEADMHNQADIKKLVCSQTIKTGQVVLWDTEHPNLYELKTELLLEDRLLDESLVTFGFRKAVFHKDGFYLNGRRLKIRGLNRHQSFPYVGYAMPESMQKRDADILKYELGVNAVRTSHYPQSHYFLDRCDELGLLVFTELPGWQHIGDEDWKKQAVENVKDMVKQYRNHTSIILWGVRINESVDDDEFYERTNAAARSLDGTRQTAGVRCYKKGSLLEDVFTYNDFVHTGKNRGCDKKSAVTSDINKPYLISEYNGHMYPSKAFDWEEHRAEHAIRHANVLDCVAGEEDIAGSFAWCMFDYNTHKDFGSGDRICYHGVMDMFRNSKLAAAVYAASQESTPVLELSSSMDIGEHPGCNRGDIYIFTNADSVKMYKNDSFIKEYQSSASPYKNMKHGPILIDDYVGNALLENEGMKKKQAEDVKTLLNEVAKVGLYNLSKQMYLKAAKLMLVYHMKMDDAVKLYNRYIGDWGGESTVYRFDAIKDGAVVKSITKQPMKKIVINADIDHNRLVEKNSYDVAAIRLRATDEYGNQLPYFNDVVSFETKGCIELIGPKTTSLHGGMGGTFIKTKGRSGRGKLVIRNDNAGDVEIEVDVQLIK